MALTTSLITGRVPLPDDAAPLAARAIFTIVGYDTEGADTIPPGAQVAWTLQSDGTLPAGARLWRNTLGTRGTVYAVEVEWSQADRQAGVQRMSRSLGFIQVGAADSYTLPQLLANPAQPEPGWYETVPRAVWEQILGLSGRVTAIEAPDWVTTPRIAGGAVSPLNLSPAVLDMLNGAGYQGLWTPASLFPGGAGTNAGQVWLVTAAGSRGGQAFTVSDRLVALVSNPSTTVYAGNWMRVQQHEVTQSATDTTAGRMLKVGDAGLLANAVAVSDWNNATAGGVIYSANNAANAPVGGSGVWFIGQYQRHNDLHGVQTLTLFTGISGTGTARQFVRALTGGVWTAWREVINQGRIVGTVAQASGVPTGAVIERGSNANGEYVRWADGTQICTRTDLSAPNASTVVGGLFSSGDVAWTFPASFAVAPVVTCAPAEAHSFGSVPYVPSTTSATLRALSAVTRAGTVPIRAQAIGRWF
ncbi:pyocin knob domain-containing protein [Pseudogemmobacter humi]|uniref:Uncharacterized protein n=1 Tax=Pseudogemmobacter humi TaxID=2483812 RepID=A0A3P5XTS6_9RHOB|nr:pyocin knob domain-containing protein [Pseudogemmobacter humi]VDC31434.1 hypothetical protein XINFAN_02890 [Pseudogemmobacter humi]